MPDWNSRLVVKYTDADGEHSISPIDSFTPTFAMTAEALHSIEQTHVGVVYGTKQMTFALQVKAIGDVVARLTRLALTGTRFSIALSEEGTDWSFQSVVMSDCIITSCNPSNAVVSGAPISIFSGFCLSSTATPAPSVGQPASKVP